MKIKIFIGRTHASFKHGLVNMVTALTSIIDGIILFISFGQLSSKLSLEWIIYSMKFKRRKKLNHT